MGQECPINGDSKNLSNVAPLHDEIAERSSPAGPRGRESMKDEHRRRYSRSPSTSLSEDSDTVVAWRRWCESGLRKSDQPKADFDWPEPIPLPNVSLSHADWQRPT